MTNNVISGSLDFYSKVPGYIKKKTSSQIVYIPNMSLFVFSEKATTVEKY